LRRAAAFEAGDAPPADDDIADAVRTARREYDQLVEMTQVLDRDHDRVRVLLDHARAHQREVLSEVFTRPGNRG
jgi:hypothetical protein